MTLGQHLDYNGTRTGDSGMQGQVAEPHVVCVVLNNNRRDDTLACLSTLRRGTYGNQTTLVLDNRSTDGSQEALRSAFPESRMIGLSENLGYAGNNNVGIVEALAAGAEWVFILNEDTVLAPDCLGRLVEAGESDQQIGIVGPMVYHFDEPEVIQSAGGLLDPWWRGKHVGKNETDRGQHAGLREVDWVSGCAIMVRRSVVEQVGALDERFFCYWEETEWCLRARKAGWKVVHVPSAKLWHKGVQRNYQPQPYVTYYSTRNRLLMYAKHHAPLGAWATAFWEIIRTLASWTIRPKWRAMSEHRDAMYHGVTAFFRGRWGQMAAD